MVTQSSVPGLRSLDEVREGVRSGYAGQLWTELVEKVEREKDEPPWTPATALPGRSEKQVKHGNREFELVAWTSNRIMDAALVALISNDRSYLDSAVAQIDSVYDFDAWPEIEDLRQIAQGDHCSLRRGQLALAIGLAYDWTQDLMTGSERERVVSGFDTRFTGPFKAALEAGDRWVNWRQNFCSVIYGGFAIAGMAFANDYHESAWLVETGQCAMDDYVGGLFGPAGEFNESVQYSGSVAQITDYLMVRYYFEEGKTKPFSDQGFEAFCRWYMYFTFPPGRVASFGDPSPEQPPVVFHYSALASALREPVFQWFYRQYADRTQPTHRKRALELLYYDPTVPETSPEGRMPLGRAYHAQGKLISSRSSWDPESTVSVVSSKAAREFSHSHADWGQVCLDGYGERLLIDLGSTPGYPKTDPGRFYNYQQWGHNVLVFDRNETGGVSLTVRDRTGDIVSESFDDRAGGRWTMDLTTVYDGADSVKRTVLHLLPRVLVVVDEASLTSEADISLRWHCCTRPVVDGADFVVEGQSATLHGRVERLDGGVDLRVERQAYEAPFDRDALGEVYEQRHEPYVAAGFRDRACRLVSLFHIQEKGAAPAFWHRDGSGGWSVVTTEGEVRVSERNGVFEAVNCKTDVGV